MKDGLVWARLDSSGATGEGAEAVVPWWSVTKPVIAAAAIRLAAAGRLGLDDLLPEGPFTLRQVLQHRAALPDYGALTDYRAAVARGDPPWSEAELLARVGGPTDGRWRYSNVGYLLARRAVERAAGAPLGAALAALVLGPLGATGTRLAETEADLAATALPPPPGYHPGWVYHGCLVGPVAEAAAVIAGLLGGDLLGAAGRAAMAAAVPVGGALPGRPWRRTGYGLGLMVGTMADRGAPPTAAGGHSGGGPGSAGAVYRFAALPGAPTVAAFGPLADPGPAEARAVALARARGADA